MPSGDRTATDKDSETFQNLLPSNHGLYGMMDLSSLAGIVEDYRFSLPATPSETTRLNALTSTSSTLESTRATIGTTSPARPAAQHDRRGGRQARQGIWPQPRLQLGPRGQEMDLIGGWTVHKGLLLEAGVGHFFRGDYVKQSLRVVGSKDANYGYIQATLNL